MTVKTAAKTAAVAAALLVLPAAFASPAHAHGGLPTGQLVEIGKLDAASIAISVGTRRVGSVGVVVVPRKRTGKPVPAARVRIY
jgi:hypothetical protein